MPIGTLRRTVTETSTTPPLTRHRDSRAPDAAAMSPARPQADPPPSAIRAAAANAAMSAAASPRCRAARTPPTAIAAAPVIHTRAANATTQTVPDPRSPPPPQARPTNTRLLAIRPIPSPTPSLRRTAPTPPRPCGRRHSGFDGGGCAGVDDQGREADCRGRRDRGGDVHVDGCLVAADPDRRALRDGPHHEFANRGEGLASRRRAGTGPGGVRTGELHGHRRQAPQRDGRDQHEGGEGRGDLRSRRPAIPQPASLRAFSMM